MALAPQLALEQGCNPYPEGGFRIGGQHRRPKAARKCTTCTCT